MSVPFLVYMCYSGSTNQVPLLVKHMAVIPEPRLCTIMKYCRLEISGNIINQKTVKYWWKLTHKALQQLCLSLEGKALLPT